MERLQWQEDKLYLPDLVLQNMMQHEECELPGMEGAQENMRRGTARAAAKVEGGSVAPGRTPPPNPQPHSPGTKKTSQAGSHAEGEGVHYSNILNRPSVQNFKLKSFLF